MKNTINKIINDEALASEDWKCVALIQAVILLCVSLATLTYFLNKPINCNPDYCTDDFCITIKGDK